MFMCRVRNQLLRNILVTLLIVIGVLDSVALVSAEDTQQTKPKDPHPDLGIVDINTGVEAAHAPSQGGYKFFDANYQQAMNLGTGWHRWKVNWVLVEAIQSDDPIYHFACRSDDCLPTGMTGEGNWFDYYKLAQEDHARNLQSLVILDEIPSFYQSGSPVIAGLFEGIFETPTGTTNDPNDPTITGINQANKWGSFVYAVMQTLGPIGVHHWQIMNELNINTLWQNDADDYVRVVEIAAKMIVFRGTNDQIVLGGLGYTWGEEAGLDNWARNMLSLMDQGIVTNDFLVNSLALHPYERSKTSYDFSSNVSDYFSAGHPQLNGIPIWLTETGSSGCGDESWGFFTTDNEWLVFCPPQEPQVQPRSTDAEQAAYMVQSMAYAFTSPSVEKYFQFHLHDFCPYGRIPEPRTNPINPTDPNLEKYKLYRPGFGLYRNWPGYEYFVGQDSNCAVIPYDGIEKPANQAFAQASHWLRNLQGYTSGGVGGEFAEFLSFPVGSNNITHVAWARDTSNVLLRFRPSEKRSGGPILVQYSDGSTVVAVLNTWWGRYELSLPAATSPLIANEDGFPIIGGEPVILLEHLLFDRGAQPPVFTPLTGSTTLSFGLNLPVGTIQGEVRLQIFAEDGQAVYARSAFLSNGLYQWVWDGIGELGGNEAPVDSGLYIYTLTVAGQEYHVSGVVGVSQPGILGCYFQETGETVPLPGYLFQDWHATLAIAGGTLVFRHEEEPPVPGLSDNDSWSARFAAYLSVTTPGMYRFSLVELDDVARLFVDGVLVSMSAWQIPGEPSKDVSPALFLRPGLHSLVVEYVQVTGVSSLEMRWQRENEPWRLVQEFWLPGPGLTETCQLENHSGTTWPTYLHDVARTGYNPGEQSLAPPLVPAWSHQPAGYHLAQANKFAVAQEVIYVVYENDGTGPTAVYALNTQDGREMWHRFLPGTPVLSSSPVIDEQTVYIAFRDTPALYALRAATGEIVWQRNFTAVPSATPVVDGGTVYMIVAETSHQSTIYALDKYAGSIQWVMPSVTASSVPGTPIIVNDVLAFSTGSNPGDGVVAIDKFTGQLLWTQPLHLLTWYGDLVGNTDNNLIYVVSSWGYSLTDTRLMALNAHSGAVVWFHDFDYLPSGGENPVLAADKLYHMRTDYFDAYLYTFHAETGQVQSQVPVPNVVGGYCCITIANDVIYAIPTSPYYPPVRALNVLTGDLLWDSSVDTTFTTLAIPANGYLFHVSATGGLLLYQPETSSSYK